MKDVELISITEDSVSHLNSSIPSLPREISALKGIHLSNGDFVVSGGYMTYGGMMNNYREVCNDEYLHYKQGSNQWTKVGTMKIARRNHSSVWIDGCLLTTGGVLTDWEPIANHEEFSLHGGVKERKEMPIALFGHSSTVIDERKILVCGGHGYGVSRILFK